MKLYNRSLKSALAIALYLFYPGLTLPQVNEEHLFKDFRWRCIGPANFAGRVVDVEALENDFTLVICASASGGVWKSVNAGTTWEPIFDNYPSASIGDVAIYQENPDILWVGTGEANNRNSVSWGDGIYKSSDGGKTFYNMGLGETYQIARIVIHPHDENIVYVAAIGYLWDYLGDRGLFKTTDGGRSWIKLSNGLPNDVRTGATDLVMDPADANTLYAAFYQRLRRPYRFDSGGDNGGIFKSTDGGASWTKLTHGLPGGETGRIGLAIYRRNPDIVMAIIEHGFQPRPNNPAYGDMTRLGSGVYRSEDGGDSWQYLNRYNNRPFYYSQIRINPLDDQLVYLLTTTIRVSEDGGRTLEAGGPAFEGGLDYHAMWIDPHNKNRYYLGKDKGLTLTHDHGRSFILFDNMPIGQFYALGVDMRDPYFVYGGTQDNGTWGGPSFSKDMRGILNDSWWKLHWGDGMFVQIDPTDWRKVYTEAENGSFRRYDAATRWGESARPDADNIVNIGDYFPDTSRGGRNRIQSFRFNWRAPLVMSPHNPRTLYLGGNHLFKTVDGGYHWQIISPDLSTNDPVKTDRNSGGLTSDATGAETHCSITSISESPLVPGVIWIGTDDGVVQITANSGATWTNIRTNIPEVPEGIWVSCVEASHFDDASCYVTFDGHRSARFDTWIYKTSDYGRTWSDVTGNLAERQAMLVIREDLKNRHLLFAGSEFACFVSINDGESWSRLMKDMPTVATHDLVIHPRDGDLIAGTHGRSIWILDDITPLQQFSDELARAEAHIFDNRPITLWEDATRGGVRGQFYFAGGNPPSIPKRDDIIRATLSNGGIIHYYLKSQAKEQVLLEISDITGKNRRTLHVPGSPGINRVLWDLQFDPGDQQVAEIKERLLNALERYAAQPDLSKEDKKSISVTIDQVKKAQRYAEIIQASSEVIERFPESMRIMRGLSGTRPSGEAGPGDYLLTLIVDGVEYFGRITVREDPMR